MNILDYVRIETSTVKDGNMDYRFGERKDIDKKRKKYWKRKDFELNETYLAKTNLKYLDNVGIVNETPVEVTVSNNDSLITNNPKVVLGLFTADCLQVTVFDPKNKILALIHSGFRWQDASIIDKTFNLMHEEFDTNPKEVLIHLGNCITPEYYSWDENIFNKTNEDSWIRKTLGKDDTLERPYKIDMREAALLNLEDIGVLKANIIDTKTDCYINKDCFSHRRSVEAGEKEGRHLTLVQMK